MTLGPESVRILEAFDSFALGVYADEHLYKIKWLHTVRWQEHAGLVLSVVELFQEADHVGGDALPCFFITVDVKQRHQALPLVRVSGNLELDVLAAACAEIDVDELVKLVGAVNVSLDLRERHSICLLIRFLLGQALVLDFHHEVDVWEGNFAGGEVHTIQF